LIPWIDWDIVPNPFKGFGVIILSRSGARFVLAFHSSIIFSFFSKW
jgi:hypothetical protein